MPGYACFLQYDTCVTGPSEYLRSQVTEQGLSPADGRPSKEWEWKILVYRPGTPATNSKAFCSFIGYSSDLVTSSFQAHVHTYMATWSLLGSERWPLP